MHPHLELMMVMKLASLAPVDLAPVVVAAAGVLYLLAEPLAGALMIALNLGLWRLALPLSTGNHLWDAGIAVAVFVAAFVIQTQVGHNVFEEGIDDTEMNLAELRRTANPVPILLVFYYHVVELLFAVGYRPSLRKAMEGFRDAELARIVEDPRRARGAEPR